MEIYSSYQSSSGTSEFREVLISPTRDWIVAGLYIATPEKIDFGWTVILLDNELYT